MTLKFCMMKISVIYSGANYIAYRLNILFNMPTSKNLESNIQPTPLFSDFLEISGRRKDISNTQYLDSSNIITSAYTCLLSAPFTLTS